MKKQIKSLIVAAVMAFVLPLQAFAVSTDAAASFQENGNQANVSVTLQHPDAGAGVTALEMTFHLEAMAGSLNQAQLSFDFNESLPGTVKEHRFNPQDNTLKVYVAGAEDGIFRNDTVNLGTIRLESSSGERIQLKVVTGTTAPDAQLSDDLKLLTGGTTMRSMAMEESSALLNAEGSSQTPDRPSRPSRPNDRDDDDDDDDDLRPSRPSRPNKPSKNDKPQDIEEAVKPTTPPPASQQPSAPTNSANAAGSSAAFADNVYSEAQLKDEFAKGDVVELDVTQRTKLSDKAFEMLKEKKGSLLKLVGRDYTWIFDSKEIKNPSVAGGIFDSAVSFTVSAELDAAIQTFAGDVPYLVFETAYSGELPGKTVLRLQLDKDTYAGKTLYVYHQPQPGEPTEIAQVTADENGIVEISMEHCSVYFLTTEQIKAGEEDSKETAQPIEPSEPAQTPAQEEGVSMGLVLTIVAAILIIAAGAGIYFYRNKKA